MYKIFAQLYKSVELNMYITNETLVLKVSEYKRKMIRSTIVAVLLVVLLSGVSYNFFPQSLLPKAPFVFAWAKGHTLYTDAIYENQTLDWDMLEFNFAFSNGSSIQEPRFGGQKGEESTISLEYHGEFNATSLQEIGFIRLTQVNILSSPENIAYNLTISKSTTISATLKTVETTDLGIYKCLNETRSIIAYTNSCAQIILWTGNTSYSGYWAQPLGWIMDINQLSPFLQGSGTASITFDATLWVSIKYEIIIEGTTETGETSLPCEGTMGTIQITYDQGKILWVKYDFQGIRLALLTIS